MIEDKELLKALKKRLGEGIISAVDNGLLISYFDKEEYDLSKSVKGFVHQLPIAVHVSAAGVGNHEEHITKYITIQEAILFREILSEHIDQVLGETKMSKLKKLIIRFLRQE